MKRRRSRTGSSQLLRRKALVVEAMYKTTKQGTKWVIIIMDTEKKVATLLSSLKMRYMTAVKELIETDKEFLMVVDKSIWSEEPFMRRKENKKRMKKMMKILIMKMGTTIWEEMMMKRMTKETKMMRIQMHRILREKVIGRVWTSSSNSVSTSKRKGEKEALLAVDK
jgi:hypothetical protein